MSNTLVQIAFIGTGECVIVNYVAQFLLLVAIIVAPIVYFLVVKSIVQSSPKHGRGGKILWIIIFTLAFIWFAGVVVFGLFLFGLCSGSILDY